MAVPLRVAVVESCEIFRYGVGCALQGRTELECVGQVEDLNDAFQLIREQHPDFLLITTSVSNSSLYLLPVLRAEHPQMAIVILADAAQKDHFETSQASCVTAILPKTITGPELVTALCSIGADGSAGATDGRDANGVAGGGLTQREQQILRCVVSGQSNKQIAYALNIAEKTVKQHLTRVFDKLGVRNRVEAAMKLHRSATNTQLASPSGSSEHELRDALPSCTATDDHDQCWEASSD